MNENSIRPDVFHDKILELSRRDLCRLLDGREYFEVTTCPACGERDFEYRFEKLEIHYVTCPKCDTFYVNPRPTRTQLEHFYKNSLTYQFWNEYVFPASEEVRREGIFKPRARSVAALIEKYEVETRTLLEVGCGFGLFCEEVGRLDVFDDVIGVEPTPYLAECCRKRGLKILEDTIENIAIPPCSVDVIASFETVEHLRSPSEFFWECHRMLSANGLLVFTCPNGKGFDIETLGPLSDSVDHEHLNYFNPESIRLLLKNCGFTAIEISTPGRLDAELVRKKVFDGMLDLDGAPFLKRVLIDDWEKTGAAFQQFLAENMLSSHLWVVAVKESRFEKLQFITGAGSDATPGEKGK